MHRSLALMILAVVLALPASGARRRSVAPVLSDALSIVFVEAAAADGSFTAAGGDAWLDVKDVARVPGNREHSTRVRRRFGLRLVRTNNSAPGMATITARLASTDGRTSMRLDGKPLTEAPIVVDLHATIGAVAFHTLEIEVSDSVASGAIAASISWEVTAQ
jgi:hypothetical protein